MTGDSGFSDIVVVSAQVDDDEVRAEDVLDDAVGRVVGQAAVEGLDEVGGGEVADSVAASTAATPSATRLTCPAKRANTDLTEVRGRL